MQRVNIKMIMVVEKKNPGEIDVRKEDGKRKKKRYAPLKEWEN